MQCAGKGVGRLVGMAEGGLVGWRLLVCRLSFVVYRLPFSVVRQRRGLNKLASWIWGGVCRLWFTVYGLQSSVREEG